MVKGGGRPEASGKSPHSRSLRCLNEPCSPSGNPKGLLGGMIKGVYKKVSYVWILYQRAGAWCTNGSTDHEHSVGAQNA